MRKMSVYWLGRLVAVVLAVMSLSLSARLYAGVGSDLKADSLFSLLYTQIDHQRYVQAKATLILMANHQFILSNDRYTINSEPISEEDQYQIDSLNYVAKKLVYANSDSARQLAQKTLLDSSKKGYDVGIAKASQILSMLFMYEGKMNESIIEAVRAYEVWNSRNDQKGLSGIYKILANTFSFHGEIDFAKYLLHQSLKINLIQKDSSAMIRAYNNFGAYCKMAGQYDSAVFYYSKALELHNNEGQKGLMTKATLLGNLGQVLEETGRYIEAIDYLKKALEINISIDNKRQCIVIYTDIGNVYKVVGNYDLAIEQYLFGLGFAQEIKDVRALCSLYLALGTVYLDIKDFDLASEYFEKALQDAISNNLEKYVGRSLVNYGDYYKKQGELEEALKHYEKSLKYFQQSNYIKGIGRAMMGQAEIYANEGHVNKAEALYQRIMHVFDSVDLEEHFALAQAHYGKFKLGQGKIEAAYEYLSKALSTVKKDRNLEALLEIYESLIMVEELRKNFEKVSYYRLRQIELKDSIFSKDQALNIARLETSNELRIKEAEIKGLVEKREQEYQLKRLYFGIALLILIILVITFFYFVAKLRHGRSTLKTQQELNRMKSRFFTNISHEQRTPLTLISGTLNQLLESNKLKTAEKNKVERVLDQASHLKKMMDGIIDLSKMEVNNLRLMPNPKNLYKLLYHLILAYESVADYKKIGYEFNLAVNRNFWVNIDEEHFSTIINNLIGNALKYTASGGRIEVSATVEKNDQLKIEVKDTGRGIPLEEQRHVFDRYYQVKAVHGLEESGMGIGLSLVRELVWLFDGEIKLMSKLGEGSVFTIILPLQPIEPVHEEEEEDFGFADFLESFNEKMSNNLESDITLLVVEDHVSMHDYLKEILNPYYQLISAADGKRALDILNDPTCKIDLLITDVMMPTLDGFTLLERLKTDDRFLGIPVIMLTARTDENDKIRGLQLGVDDYLTKPFSEAELLARINNLLKRKQEIAGLGKPLEQDKLDLEVFSSDTQLLLQIKEKLREQISNAQYSIQDLSDDLNMSRRTVLRKVKRATGMSVTEFLREIRLTEAREKLMSGTYRSVSEVSYAVGFESPGYFTKLYFKRFGKKPSDFIYENID